MSCGGGCGGISLGSYGGCGGSSDYSIPLDSGGCGGGRSLHVSRSSCGGTTFTVDSGGCGGRAPASDNDIRRAFDYLRRHRQ